MGVSFTDSKATLVYGSPLPLSFLAWLSGPLTIWPSPAFHIFFPLHSFTLSGLWWYSVAQSCLALCDPMDCSPPGSSVHGISQSTVLECCHFLLQGIFPTQGSNPSLLHWQRDSLSLHHLESLTSLPIPRVYPR